MGHGEWRKIYSTRKMNSSQYDMAYHEDVFFFELDD